MSDFVGNQQRHAYANHLIDSLIETPRALDPQEAKLLAIEAYKYRHLSAHFDAKVRGHNPPPYVQKELALRPDAPCPLCQQNVRIVLSGTEP